jgi:hypothetical protein
VGQQSTLQTDVFSVIIFSSFPREAGAPSGHPAQAGK